MSTIVNNNIRRTASSTKGRQNAPSSNIRNLQSVKKSSFDKPVSTDGVYADARFTHVIFTLVGMNVQVQVKNGSTYEGIFKTVSPQMDVVLEVAHKVEVDPSNNSGQAPSAPTRDMILEKLIFKKDDVVSVTSLSVDLDYAVKDTFTDAAITRGNNGSNFDVELQPWDGEAGEEIGGGLEEGESSSNGWDANDMFRTNQEQFSVKSSYDESLTQYTTALNKNDSKEYRKREEDARRIAREIERSEDYRKHIDLENGDDEEALFSSVHRPNNQQTGGDKKYLPPHARRNNNNTKGQGNGVDNYQQRPSHNNNKNRPVQQQQHQNQLSSSSQQQIHSSQNFSPSLQQQQHMHAQQQQPPVQQQHVQQQQPVAQQQQSPVQHLQPTTQHQQQQPTGHQQPVQHSQQSVHQQQSGYQTVQHKQHSVHQRQQHHQSMQQQQQPIIKTTVHVKGPPVSNKEDNVNKTNGEEKNVNAAQDLSIAKTSQSEVSQQPTVPSQELHENKSTRQAKTINDLKDFNAQFKLGEKKESDNRKTDNSKREDLHVDNVDKNDNKDVNMEDDSNESSGKVTPAKYQLNPFAEEFKPKVTCTPTRVHPAQTPTPPRPQTQSPVVTPVMPTYYYPVVPQQASRQFQPKKKIRFSSNCFDGATAGVASQQAAVVSAYPQPDYRTAAQHATGQPLLAGTIPPLQYSPYMMTPQMIQHGGGYSVVSQPRMMNPVNIGPSSHTAGSGIDPNQANPQTVYMSQPGPIPVQAHLNQQAMQQNQPSQLPHPGSNPPSQGVQMTGVTGHHPAPSPVQQVVQGGQANHPGQVPPTAGTPQPMNYPQISLQGHLHGSHNPTSPQTIHTSNPYTYSYNAPQFTFSQGQPTSVSYTMPSQMQSAPVPNHLGVVMMPPPSNQVQQHQFQHHMAGPTMTGQGHIMHHGIPGQGPSHPQVQYISHVPSQGPPVIPYQQGQ